MSDSPTIKFTKPFLTIPKQIEQLKSRGMQFQDEEKAGYFNNFS